MPRIMFTISYSIIPEQRETYLGLIRQLRDHLVNTTKKNYAVYEMKGKRHHFTEVYMFGSQEEFDALDDTQDERTQELLTLLEGCIDENSKKYSTYAEVS